MADLAAARWLAEAGSDAVVSNYEQGRDRGHAKAAGEVGTLVNVDTEELEGVVVSAAL